MQKSFFVSADPKNKDLAELQDKIVNEWLAKHPEVRNVRTSVAADLSGTFGKSVVVLTYDGPEAKGAR